MKALQAITIDTIKVSITVPGHALGVLFRLKQHTGFQKRLLITTPLSDVKSLITIGIMTNLEADKIRQIRHYKL